MILKVSSGRSAAVMLRYCAEKEGVTKEGDKTERCTAQSNSLGLEDIGDVRDAWAVTRQSWDKDTEIRYHHASLSLDPRDPKARDLSDEQLLRMGESFAEKWAPGHDHAVFVHRDREHPHVHVLMNSVNSEDGNKLHKSPQDLEEGIRIKDELSREYGLRVVERERMVESDRLSGDAARMVERNPDAYLWTEDLKGRIAEAKGEVTSFEDFQKRLGEEGVTANPRGKNGEITYSFVDDNDKQRKCREGNLGTDYSRESIERACGENQKRTELEKDTARRSTVEEWRGSEKTEPLAETRGASAGRNSGLGAPDQGRATPGSERGSQALVCDPGDLGGHTRGRVQEALAGFRERVAEFKEDFRQTTERLKERIGELKEILQDKLSACRERITAARMPHPEPSKDTTPPPVRTPQETPGQARDAARMPVGYEEQKKAQEASEPQKQEKRQVEME